MFANRKCIESNSLADALAARWRLYAEVRRRKEEEEEEEEEERGTRHFGFWHCRGHARTERL